jgi:serine/threonine protein phosphatase PrpC
MICHTPDVWQVSSGGEDAYFIEGMWAGVADGVGGWALSGQFGIDFVYNFAIVLGTSICNHGWDC